MQIFNRLELEINNDFQELRRMSEWLHKACQILAISDSVAMNLDLCANEAVTNIIQYAYADNTRHIIYIGLSIDEKDVVCLLIRDNGKSFNPFEIQPPTPFKDIEYAPIGGLGIHLIKGLMEECNYQRIDGKNVITLKAHQNNNQCSSSDQSRVLEV